MYDIHIHIYIYCRIMYTHKISSLRAPFAAQEASTRWLGSGWWYLRTGEFDGSLGTQTRPGAIFFQIFDLSSFRRRSRLSRHVDHHCGPLWTCVLPSGYVKIAIENGPVEIVDLPIKNSGSFHSYVTVDQRVPFTTMYNLSAGLTKDDILDSVNAHMFQDTSTRALRYSVTDSWKPGIQTCAPVWTSLKIHRRISTYFNSTKFGMRQGRLGMRFVKSISFQHSPIAAQLDEKAEPSEEKDSKIYIKVFPSRSKGGDVKKEGQIWSLHVFTYTSTVITCHYMSFRKKYKADMFSGSTLW